MRHTMPQTLWAVRRCNYMRRLQITLQGMYPELQPEKLISSKRAFKTSCHN